MSCFLSLLALALARRPSRLVSSRLVVPARHGTARRGADQRPVLRRAVPCRAVPCVEAVGSRFAVRGSLPWGRRRQYYSGRGGRRDDSTGLCLRAVRWVAARCVDGVRCYARYAVLCFAGRSASALCALRAARLCLNSPPKFACHVRGTARRWNVMRERGRGFHPGDRRHHRRVTLHPVCAPPPALPQLYTLATPLQRSGTRAHAVCADDGTAPCGTASSTGTAGSAARGGSQMRALPPPPPSGVLPARRMFISSTTTRRKCGFSRGSRARARGGCGSGSGGEVRGRRPRG